MECGSRIIPEPLVSQSQATYTDRLECWFVCVFAHREERAATVWYSPENKRKDYVSADREVEHAE